MAADDCRTLPLMHSMARIFTHGVHVTNVLFSIFRDGRMMSLLDIEKVLAGSCGGTAAGRSKKLIAKSFHGLGAAEASCSFRNFRLILSGNFFRRLKASFIR
jgi:hypothetical protein